MSQPTRLETLQGFASRESCSHSDLTSAQRMAHEASRALNSRGGLAYGLVSFR